MGIVIDLIIVGIVLLMVLISAKRGFVRVAIEVAGFVAVILFVTSVSGPLADITYQRVVEPPIINSATEIVIDGSAEAVDSVWESLPQFVTDNADQFGITKEKVKESVQGEDNDSKEALTKVSQELVKPVVVVILDTLYSVILITVLLFVVKILAKLLNKVFSFSIVGKLNNTLGGVLGVIKGLVIALIFCKTVLLIISFTDNGFWIFTSENIAKTFIFKFLTNVF